MERQTHIQAVPFFHHFLGIKIPEYLFWQFIISYDIFTIRVGYEVFKAPIQNIISREPHMV